jgi:hypothetical protein
MEARMLSSFHLCNGITMNRLTQAIWDGNVLVGTDGSILNNKATYTTVIIIDLDNENPTFAASAGGKLPSLAKFIDMDSHQLEAAALPRCFTSVNTHTSKRIPTFRPK